jgi:hypothetical protein
MAIDGIVFSKNKSSDILVFHIEKLSIELKNLIRSNLAIMCRGEEKFYRNPKLYSYDRTLSHFMKRYNEKSRSTKKGMMGELLAHVIILEFLKKMQPASIFFNLEEKSIKKGFDIVLFDNKEKELWIAEVKSGHAKEKESNSKNRLHLQKARDDLAERLNEHNETIWDNAINGATIYLKSGSRCKNKVLELLDVALFEAEEKKDKSLDRNVILVSVLYKTLKDKVSIEGVLKFHSQVEKKKIFKKVISFSIQKETYEKIEEFLKNEMAA